MDYGFNFLCGLKLVKLIQLEINEIFLLGQKHSYSTIACIA